MAEGEGMGLYKTASSLGGLLGPALGGAAVAWAGSYNAAAALGVAGIAAALVLALILRPTERRRHRGVDTWTALRISGLPFRRCSVADAAAYAQRGDRRCSQPR